MERKSGEKYGQDLGWRNTIIFIPWFIKGTTTA